MNIELSFKTCIHGFFEYSPESILTYIRAAAVVVGEEKNRLKSALISENFSACLQSDNADIVVKAF